MSSRFTGVFATGLVLLTLVLGIVPPAGIAQEDPSGATSAPLIINMHNSEYEPMVAMALVNQTVNWINGDSFAHDVTGVDTNLSSEGGPGGMAGGDQWGTTFTEPGVIDYYCTVHSTGRGNGMWGRLIVVKEPMVQMAGAGGEANPEEFGVRWLAHWVGIISFVAVLAVLVIYYFVLKYGETVHATDHRDRKEK